MNTIIRPMVTTDWNIVKDIYLEGIETNLATFQTDCPTFDEWDNSHLKFGRFVIEDDTGVLGWAALTPVSSRCVYSGVAEVSIYIAESARGKGVGVSLLNNLVKSSEDNDIWTLQAGIMQDNIASIKLHEKCGFRIVGYRERIGKDRYGVWRNTILMERRRKDD